MSARLAINNKFHQGFQSLVSLDNVIRDSQIDKWYQEIIKIRASHLNGCAYCVDKHTQDAISLNINPRKINLIPVWKEATDHFTEQEQTILQLTEQITLIHEDGLSDNVYSDAVRLFGEELTAQLIMAATVINAWNRVGVSLKMQPEFK
ncbi:alkylhydroperoxidase AhpD family core domain-containing protein [Dyadobacter koreensis]|uniref:Alkylhydroperoxidase AhpD family core domain-containing protein n=1 Tax=Dyadobacter koreensis TaxID=408657 RepID=A0A1H6YTL0_9BACT|nr:carboxymuconolactone decarboxylase family protein [Dyadobacter koreensis]SEJ40075.1 alkylhydroperoxidase AhpD family core domain-containing protein [Dyadobacter koreensis]